MSNGAEAAASFDPSNFEQTVGDSVPFYVDQAGGGSGPNSGSFPSLSSGLLDEDPRLVNPDSKYECPVCILHKFEHKLLRDPVQTACGHRMCQSCVEIYLQDAPSKKCPADEEDCEQVTRNNIFPDPGFRREMKQLLVYCVNEDCKEEIKLSMLEKHVKDCVHRKVQCINSPLGCTEQIKFKDAEDHLKKCGFRPVICEQCGSEFSFNSKQEHDLEQCPEAVVICTYLCGQEMKRRLLEDHKAVCPKKPAECQFKTLGCTFTGNSDEVKKHEKDVGSHFQVLLECFTAFRLQSLDMQKNLEDLRRNHEESKRATERIDSFVKTIHKDLKLKMVQQVERLIIAEQKMEEQIQTMTRTTEELQHVQQSIEQLSKPFKHEHVEHFYHPY